MNELLLEQGGCLGLEQGGCLLLEQDTLGSLQELLDAVGIRIIRQHDCGPAFDYYVVASEPYDGVAMWIQVDDTLSVAEQYDLILATVIRTALKR